MSDQTISEPNSSEQDSSELALDSLTRDQFEPHLGSHFEIVFDDGTRHPLELSEVRNVFAGGDRAAKRQAFALGFLGSAGSYARQGTYRFSHPHLGSLGFFIVPLGPDPQQSGRMRYEAIFT